MSKKPINDNNIPERPPVTGQAYELWRPKVVVDAIAEYMDKHKEKGYIYKGVIMNYPLLPLNVQDHEKMGYEIVYSTHQFVDNRGFAPDVEKKDTSVPAPVIKNTKDGYQYLLMRIDEKKAQENEMNRSKRDKERHLKSVKNVSKGKDGIRTDGGFINLNRDNFGDE